MRKLFSLLSEEIKSGKDSVLVTVIASSGSAPRGAGAHMLVTKKGRLYGTIGGGAVEFHCEKTAQEILTSKKSHTKYYRLHENQIQDLGMICGGDVHIYFQYIPAYDSCFLSLTKIAENMYLQGEQSWLIYKITSNQDKTIGIFGKDSGLSGIDVPDLVIERLGNKPFQTEYGGHVFYCEKLVQPGVVYIFGGGHVAQALVPALDAVNFSCMVLEDREEFCRPELFDKAGETRLIDNNCIADYVTLDENDYVVILTRGHKDDQKIQEQVLRTPACYIGVIGSRKKSETVFFNLRKKGFTDNDLRRITTPIGLDIKAETPEEIAVSITAQLILIRAGHSR